MILLADVNVSRRVVDRLREEGFDTVRVSDILDPRTEDREIVAEARRRGAVLLSHDQDFTAILATSGAMKPSLVNIRVSAVEIDTLSRRISSALQITQRDLEEGAVVTLDDRGVRVHRLPVGRV